MFLYFLLFFEVDVRVNYGDELESLIRSTVEGGSVDQIRDLLIAEVSKRGIVDQKGDLLIAEVS